MQNAADNPLLTLTQTLDDSCELYRVASTRTQLPSRRRQLWALADLRDFAQAYIRPYLQPQRLSAQPPPGGAPQWLGNRYARLLDGVSADDGLELIRQVEQHTIEALQSAASRCNHSLVSSVLRDLATTFSRNAARLEAAGDREVAH